jgi:uncharacterized LabA/DUF88 family protein
MTGIRVPSDPHLRRWMLFIDGENLTIRAQEWAKVKGFPLIEGGYYLPNVFVWIPGAKANTALTNTGNPPLEIQPYAIRSYYYTSVVGDEPKRSAVRRALWELGFHPEVFKKTKQDQKAKGVDIALAKDFLSNAYNDNYDVAVLVAGDGDYIPLVEEVKRLGKVVYVAFFCDKGFGLNEDLELSSDRSFEFGSLFQEKWVEFAAKHV